MEKIAVVYWSGTGNTEAMAKSIADGINATGAEAVLLTPAEADAAALTASQKLAFGCPSMGAEELEDTEFEPLYSAVEPSLSGKKVALFGTYGWGDGEWMRTWQARAQAAGVQLFEEGYAVQENEREDAEGIEFGKRFAAF